ncbi:MAG TPA: hypothetical protein VGB06_04580, partial [Solirubrobacterales bacterium]
KPVVSFSEAQAAIAGFLASVVAAGTAAVLGIEVQKPVEGVAQPTAVARLRNAVTKSDLLVAGIVVYAVVGVLILLVWFFDSNEAPEMVGTFALGALGWLAGAFSAVFAAKSG